MNQKGLLVVAAVVLVLAAAGALFFSLQTSQNEPNPLPPSEQVSLRTSEQTVPNEFTGAMNSMKHAIGDAGFAATFASGEKQWVVNEGHKVERFSIGKDAAFARLTSSVPMDKSKIVDGLYVELPLEFAQSANGRKVQIGIVARAAQSNPTSRFSALYATQQAGNSGWQSISAGENFQLHTFEFQVPKLAEGYAAQPVISIRADNEGSGRGLELIGVYAKVLPPPPFSVDFGEKTAKWIVPKGHELTAIQSSGGLVVGRLVSNKPLKRDATNLGDQGATIQIAPETVQKLNGKRVRVSISARSSASNPSPRIWAVFATQQFGNSGWKDFPLTSQLSTFSFEFLVPKTSEGYTKPSIIVLHADDTGSGMAVDVRSVEIQVVP